jgi:Flp pilus assembly protein TadB
MDIFEELNDMILEERKLINQLEKADERKSQEIINEIRTINNSVPQYMEKLTLNRQLGQERLSSRQTLYEPKIDFEDSFDRKKPKEIAKKIEAIVGSSSFEKETLKRLRRKEKVVEIKKEKKASAYVKTANGFFSKQAADLSEKKYFRNIKRDLIKANLNYLPTSYIAVILLSTAISVIIALFLFIFFMFFSISATMPFISTIAESYGARFLKVFWIIFVVPIGTFFFMYLYPSMEKRYNEVKIDEELPFVTIHMSAIVGSMIEPSKIFNIIVETKEYPFISREFTKLINNVNIYGYDLVTALRSTASNCPSKKLANLFNGFSTTISSGGDLVEFFEKRAQTLLFEYKLEREKQNRAAETFMDIYISVVIAAPMILMLLLIVMSVSGLGLSLGPGTITLLIIMGVSVINIIFLAFLSLRNA